MIGLLQRVTGASVEVAGREVARIGAGLLVLAAVEPGDSSREAARLAERLLNYRVFDDGQGRMNRSLLDTGGGLLLVPQFTLAADTKKGNRPGFSTAAAPAASERLFGELLAQTRARLPATQAGVFGAHMRVQLENDGPVTFWLRVAPAGS
ncbi:MAG: D-tyrosyl-tRNA(Tyr) deacylase [Gammaproteobacteria bacterium]|nr:D-tyrosyl-tRNA(Tyr) deacylase [Gammaproteobacteria bacterium]